MTDRELLENAAKAAGLTIHANNQASRDACGAGDVGLWISRESTCWNPLTDDSAALRLAVKLKMNIHLDSNMVDVDPDGVSWFSEAYLDDPYAATRRAIVRAAAEIGKNL